MVAPLFSTFSPGEVWKLGFDDQSQCHKVILSAALIAGGQEVIISHLDDSIKIGNGTSLFLNITANREAMVYDASVYAALSLMIANQTFGTQNVKVLNAAIPFVYDSWVFASTSTSDSFIYKTGGVSGSVVTTLTYNYTDSTGNTLLSWTRSP